MSRRFAEILPAGLRRCGRMTKTPSVATVFGIHRPKSPQLLGRYRVAVLIGTHPLTYLTGVQAGVRPGVAAASAVCGMSGEEFTHPLRGIRLQLAVQPLINVLDRGPRVVHEVGVLHVDHAARGHSAV